VGRAAPDVNNCMLCNSRANEILHRGVRYGPTLQVRRCKRCGLVFLWPRPNREDLDEYYLGAYRGDYDETPVEERHRGDLDEARVRVRRLLPLLRPESKLFEVGCGSGAFLDAVIPYVGEVAGVEPDMPSRDWIVKVLRVSVGERVDAFRKGKEAFDFVVLFHVLEHITDPIDFLRGLKHLLKPTGKLIIEVPNVDDALVSVYETRAYVRFYYQKAHLYYFSPDTLAQVIEKAGFSVDVKGIQRYDLSNHIRWMLTGKGGGQGYYNDLFSSSANAAYADALIQGNRSDTLWAIAQLRR
jgi:SAM-dependent methyltransferase